ncbi:hypothetical protein [Coraliomargarita parva]|uniref:hypothetical protein n=1 Tax=Coraliomargarita parva TaxID=3014050 RepID=UPI0022B3E554|nr:hypothetical protein [Coraliomargarita parva]
MTYATPSSEAQRSNEACPGVSKRSRTPRGKSLELFLRFKGESLSIPVKLLLDILIHATNFGFRSLKTAFDAIVLSIRLLHENINIPRKTNRASHDRDIGKRFFHV